MLVFPLLLAPVVIVVAGRIERRLGPSAAGWVAALPIAFAVAVIACVAAARVTWSGVPRTCAGRRLRPT